MFLSPFLIIFIRSFAYSLVSRAVLRTQQREVFDSVTIYRLSDLDLRLHGDIIFPEGRMSS